MKTTKIVTMFNLQNELNTASAGDSWVSGYTSEGREINWRLCISQEMSEMIDSFPWKHWKSLDSAADIANAKIEAVDVWHFILSETITDTSRANYETKGLNYLLNEIEDKFIEAEMKKKSTQSIIDTMFEFQSKVFDSRMIGLQLMEEFIPVTVALGLSYEELYELYIGKNILNKFRQDNGYKDGTYKKIWNGEEDNVVMTRILKEDKGKSSMDEIYNKIEAVYLTLNNPLEVKDTTI